MKKLALTLTLLSGLTLSSMAPLQAMQPTDQQKTLSPRLIAILKKKYIKKEPLSADEKAYFGKVKATIGIAGLVAILVGVLVAGIGLRPHIKRWSEEAEKREAEKRAAGLREMMKPFTQAGVKVEDRDQRELQRLIKDAHLSYRRSVSSDPYWARQYPVGQHLHMLLRDNQAWMRLYHDLSQQKNFKRVLSGLVSLTVEKLPTVGQMEGTGAYYLED